MQRETTPLPFGMLRISCKGRFHSFNPSHPHSRITARTEPSQNPSLKQSSPRSGQHRALSTEPPPTTRLSPSTASQAATHPLNLRLERGRVVVAEAAACKKKGREASGHRAPRDLSSRRSPARRHAPKPRKHMSARTIRRCGRRLGSHTAGRAREGAAESPSPPSGPSRARSSSAMVPPSPGRSHVTTRHVTGATHNAPRLP